MMKTMMAAAAISIAAGTPALASELVQNGGFEKNIDDDRCLFLEVDREVSVPSWHTQVLEGIGYVGSAAGIASRHNGSSDPGLIPDAARIDGKHALVLKGSGECHQDIPAGGRARLSFIYGSCEGLSINGLEVAINGKTVWRVESAPDGYDSYVGDIEVPASIAPRRISFRGTKSYDGGLSAVFVDRVSVQKTLVKNHSFANVNGEMAGARCATLNGDYPGASIADWTASEGTDTNYVAFASNNDVCGVMSEAKIDGYYACVLYDTSSIEQTLPAGPEATLSFLCGRCLGKSADLGLVVKVDGEAVCAVDDEVEWAGRLVEGVRIPASSEPRVLRFEIAAGGGYRAAWIDNVIVEEPASELVKVMLVDYIGGTEERQTVHEFVRNEVVTSVSRQVEDSEANGYLIGYFTEPDGKGLQYFDRDCRAVSDVRFPGDITLYAYRLSLGDADSHRIDDVIQVANAMTMAGQTLTGNHIYDFGPGLQMVQGFAAPGVRIASGTTVFYLRKGANVIFFGSSALKAIDEDGADDYNTRAHPGIEVDPGARLIVAGEGFLSACGGSGLPPRDGEKGVDAVAVVDEKSEKLMHDDKGSGDYAAGGGGAGGAGGSGSAPGIGGPGGAGGRGAVDRYAYYRDADCELNGENGYIGGEGGSGGGMGEVMVLGSVMLNAVAGQASDVVADGGGSGKDDFRNFALVIPVPYYEGYYLGGGGGGGGGGLGGAAALAIGGGGAGGGGGGSGGGGGLGWRYWASDEHKPFGEGGKGGRDYGNAGSGEDGDPDHWEQIDEVGKVGSDYKSYRGGSGGAGGYSGLAGADGDFYCSYDVVRGGYVMSRFVRDFGFGRPELERKITFRSPQLAADVERTAQIGVRLPALETAELPSTDGRRFGGAYLVEQDGTTNLWYDAEGRGLHTFDGVTNVVLTVVYVDDVSEVVPGGGRAMDVRAGSICEAECMMIAAVPDAEAFAEKNVTTDEYRELFKAQVLQDNGDGTYRTAMLLKGGYLSGLEAYLADRTTNEVYAAMLAARDGGEPVEMNLAGGIPGLYYSVQTVTNLEHSADAEWKSGELLRDLCGHDGCFRVIVPYAGGEKGFYRIKAFYTRDDASCAD